MNNAIDTHIVKYGLVGLSGMAIDFTITWLCKEKLGINKYLSNAVGFCFAVTSNFIFNRQWTFESHTQEYTGQFARFILVALTGLLINNLLLYLFVKKFNLNFYVLKLTVIGCVFLWNYLLNLLFTFN